MTSKPLAVNIPDWRRPLPLMALVAGFGLVLYDWIGFVWKQDLFSYGLLIPFVSAYLVHLRRSGDRHVQQTGEEKSSNVSGGRWLTIAACLFGLATLVVGWSLNPRSWPEADRIALWMFAFVCLWIAGIGFCFGAETVARHRFALLFLFFMVPLPDGVVHAIEVFFQHTSAWAAAGFLELASTTMVHDGLRFELPGITLQVAEECSGIRSSLALFITSILAGHMFLKSRNKRILLALLVIPLGILRNGFRIFTIAQLCIHVGPEMVNSVIHRKGGPLFFGLSLIPFFLVLWWMRRLEGRAKAPL
ncbi:MAG TPA: exosortase/archaeosortase family protein [Candidatus Paceibacterota bacterium]|nr:exosortase/archaeosortase family protein [Candidatus Paceibacterota bacterium]